MHNYLLLDSSELLATAEKLLLRVTARFPQDDIRELAATVVTLTQRAKDRAALLEEPVWWARALLIIALVLD